jgi:hypothetical protein
MKWSAQVVHVARKDIRFGRWLLLAYTAVVVAAAASVFAEWTMAYAYTTPFGWIIYMAVVGLGMFTVATLVQADSPSRSDAYWPTLPFRASAVFTAKLLVMGLVLVGIGLVGQLTVLLLHAVPVSHVPRILGASAQAYGFWLVLAALLAAVTPDLRTFVVGLVATLFLWLVGASALSYVGYLRGSASELPVNPSRVTPFLMLGGPLLAVWHQYVTRNTRRSLVLAGLFMGVAVARGFSAQAAEPVLPAAGDVPGPLRGSLSVELPEWYRTAEWRFTVHLDGASASHEYRLVSPVVHLEWADGSTTEIPLREGTIPLNDPRPRLGEALRWLGEEEQQILRVSVDPGLTSVQRDAVLRGDVRLTVAGHVEVHEPRLHTQLVLEEGAVAVAEGWRARLVDVDETAQPPVVRVRTSVIALQGAAGRSARREWSMLGSRAPRYALVNDGRQEAVHPMTGGGSGIMGGRVLPGIQGRGWDQQLLARPYPMGAEPQPLVDAEWLQGARLLFFEWDLVGSYPVSAPLRREPTTPGAAESRQPVP